MHALRQVVRSVASAYGFTLSVAMTLATLTRDAGTPKVVDLAALALGVVLAFTLLERLAGAARAEADGAPEHVVAPAATLDLLAVGAVLAVVSAIGPTGDAWPTWGEAGIAATLTYATLLAAQIALVGRLRRRAG